MTRLVVGVVGLVVAIVVAITVIAHREAMAISEGWEKEGNKEVSWPDIRGARSRTWIIFDSSMADGQENGPCKMDDAHVFQAAGGALTPCSVPAGKSIRHVEFSVTVIEAMTLSTEDCDFCLTVDGGGCEEWSRIAVGDGQTPTCEEDSLADTDLDAIGESCRRINGTGSIVVPGSNWRVLAENGNGAGSCTSVVSVEFEARWLYE